MDKHCRVCKRYESECTFSAYTKCKQEEYDKFEIKENVCKRKNDCEVTDFSTCLTCSLDNFVWFKQRKKSKYEIIQNG